MIEYMIEVGEDGGGYGRPRRPNESVSEFLRERVSREDSYWGQGLDPEDAECDVELLSGWEGVEVLAAMAWDLEPAVWACVRVPEGTRVIDFGGASSANRYHAPCVELEVPDEEG